jgi:hypothetical protein
MDATIPTIVHKRAVDIMLPPDQSQSTKNFVTDGASVLDWLIPEYVRNKFTGAILSSDNRRKCRSTILLLRGSVVGGIRTSVSRRSTGALEEALRQTLADLRVAGANVESYPLPESKVFALSSFFIGESVIFPASEDAATSLLHVVDSIRAGQTTACLNVKSQRQSFMLFFYQGQYVDTFNITARQSLPSFDAFKTVAPASTIEDLRAVTLSPDMVASDPIAFGINLLKFDRS